MAGMKWNHWPRSNGMAGRDRLEFARVSTKDQNSDSQEEALRRAGCARIYRDIASGALSERSGLEQCLNDLTEGDTLIVWKLDRLGRSLPHLVHVVTLLKERGVGFKSLTEGVVDTTTPAGELVFSIFAVLAQFERGLIRERTQAGLAAAREKGRIGGRPSLSPNNRKVKLALEMTAKNMKIKDICLALGISRSTYYRYLKLNDE
nr:recombinase family protein [uncultured Desulfobulbus sp.]